jgi:hypothetical protein
MIGIMLLLPLAISADSADPGSPNFTEVQIEEPFDDYLLANPLLMEVTGAKIIRRGEDEFVVLGVASTALKDGSPIDRLRAVKVCRTKALAAVIGEKQGVQVGHIEAGIEETIVVVEDGEEMIRSISEYLQITRTKVEGVAKDMPVVGTWESEDGQVFYLAIGILCDGDGESIERSR